MLDEYVDQLTEALAARRQVELEKLELGAEDVSLVRGRAQAYAAALLDIKDLLEKFTEPTSAPEAYVAKPKFEQPRSSYGHMGVRRAPV